jgi:hypothetical protein
MKQPKASKTKDVSREAAAIAEWAAKSLIAAEDLGIKHTPLRHFFLSPAQRELLLLVPGVSKTVKAKLADDEPVVTAAEVGGMLMALAENLPDSNDTQRLALFLVANHLTERLHDGIIGPSTIKRDKSEKPKSKTTATKVFQFKITLLGIKPPIWRRIQTKDCTLDKLHEHIQTAMGWTNSHLHQFIINGVIHGDPQLLDDGWEETPPVNSRRTKLSKIVPKDGTRSSFQYEYDFGDGWEHEVLFEGFLPAEKGVRYPLCVEGERACPPEDVGGTHGYQEYVRAMANPRHKQHKEFLEWSGPFDPEKFDAQAATKEMRKGLPDWRNEEEWI